MESEDFFNFLKEFFNGENCGGVFYKYKNNIIIKKFGNFSFLIGNLYNPWIKILFSSKTKIEIFLYDKDVNFLSCAFYVNEENDFFDEEEEKKHITYKDSVTFENTEDVKKYVSTFLELKELSGILSSSKYLINRLPYTDKIYHISLEKYFLHIFYCGSAQLRGGEQIIEDLDIYGDKKWFYYILNCCLMTNSEIGISEKGELENLQNPSKKTKYEGYSNDDTEGYSSGDIVECDDDDDDDNNYGDKGNSENVIDLTNDDDDDNNNKKSSFKINTCKKCKAIIF